jgi:DegV family protein with EDD domain
MKKIKLITDGSCDLPIDIINKYDIGIAHLNVSFGEETFISEVEIDNNTFYKKMREEKELPKTSCPSPDRFMNLFECEEESILVLTLSSKLSGTYSSAVLAKDTYLSENNNNKDIRIIDTLTGSVGAGLLLIKAAKMIEEGKNIDEIVEKIENIKDNVVFFGALDTLENAIKGGRVNPLAGKLINALNFKVIVHITDGVVKPVDNARGEQGSIKKVLSKIEKNNDINSKMLNIGHANCIEKALKIKNILEEKYNFEEIVISEVGAVMGTYTSEGAVLVSVL